MLSFGSRVKVIGPDHYRKELIATAQNFLYDYVYSCRQFIV
ncbi:hypothetical protein [Blautia pseudococcoides]